MPGPSHRDLWPAPSTAPALPADEVHVWRCPVDLPAEVLARCRGILNPAEQARADGFLKTADRRRFSVARAGLRLLLGCYLGCGPRDIALAAGAHGKPRLETGDPALILEFNVSHAGNMVLMAFAAAGRPVGVDVERADRRVKPLDLAPRVLSPAEIRVLEDAPASQRARMFLTLWTVKEAAVKALGRGISMPLSSFTVTFAPDAPPRLTAGPGAAGISDLTVLSLAPDEGHLGAVAAAGSGWSLRRWSATGILATGPALC